MISANEKRARDAALAEYESEMRAALGIGRQVNPRPAKAPGLLVVLSVRHPDGGLPFRYEYRAQTIIRALAQMDAERQAREQGLRVHALLEIREDEHD